LKVLIDLFWSKYSDLKAAVRNNDAKRIASLDREIDPLLEAITQRQTADAAEIQLQFKFAIDLLNEEAEDRGCVVRNSHFLEVLVRRYIPLDARQDSAVSDVEAIPEEPFLDLLSDRVLVIAPGYRVLFSNAANAASKGLAKADAVGRHVGDFVGMPIFHGGFRDSLDRCLTGEAETYTYADTSSGRTKVICCRMTPSYSPSGDLIGALTVIHETSDRRRQRAA
jgi:hypothetical protein